MANTTIYPYGTNGQLPSSIGVINDLTTGGADKALSAEMGKLVGGREENDRARIDAIVPILKKAVFKDDESSAFAELDSLASAVDSISLNQSTIISSNGAQGATYQLTATTSPAGGTVSWSSSDASVASVDNTGLVEIVGNGTCTITATSGGKTATCSVTVSGIVALPDGFQGNKAWTNNTSTGSAGGYNVYSDTPTDLDGYCVTPFYSVMLSNGSVTNDGESIVYTHRRVKIKAGYTADTVSDGVVTVEGDIANGFDLWKDASGSNGTAGAARSCTRHNEDPKVEDKSTNLYVFVSATMKISELANCYIYDYVKAASSGTAAGYLFAGSNVDKSKTPSQQ